MTHQSNRTEAAKSTLSQTDSADFAAQPALTFGADVKMASLNGHADTQNKPDFNHLLEQVASTRNRASFVMLFDHFAPRIKGYLMQGGFPEGEAEEIAQDTMLQVWQKAALFKAERASASTWIYTIARNRKIDRLRKYKPVMLDLDDLMAHNHNEELADGVHPDISLGHKELATRLTGAIHDLPKEQAALVKQAFFEDMSHTDIARKMRLPLGTVKSRLRSGLARLRKALDNKGGDSPLL